MTISIKRGLTFEGWLEQVEHNTRQEAKRRWNGIFVPTERQEEIEALDEALVLAFVKDESMTSLVMMPYLEILHELNPKIRYVILSWEDNYEVVGLMIEKDTLVKTTDPILICYNQQDEMVGSIVGYPARFKKRLQGLDEEDTNELIKRYELGYYNNEIMGALIEMIGGK